MKVFHFNPSCEMEVANKLPYFRPPKLVQHLLFDGQHLPIYFGQPGDKVLVTTQPSENFIAFIKQLGYSGSDFLHISNISSLNNQEFIPSPWGWSPTEAQNFQNWFPKVAGNFKWNPEFQNWYRRESAAEILNKIVEQDSQFDITLVPEQCIKVEQVEKLLKRWGNLVMKAPLSSSGRGVQFLRKPVLNTSNKQWIQGVLEQQGCVMVEQLREKVFDFSFHFFKHKSGEVEFVGETAFLTNSNGKYRGNYIGRIADAPGFPESIQMEALNKVLTHLQEAITNESRYENYEGYLGIDLMIYKEDLQLKLHPCVEINTRHSMGLLAIFLQKWITAGKKAKFSVEVKNEVNEPLFHMEKDGNKISSCYWPLNDFWNSEKFVFMLKVE